MINNDVQNDEQNDKIKKAPVYYSLTKIIVALFGVICIGIGVFSLFGLTKIHVPQTKTQGKVIGISVEYINLESTFIYTFEYMADDGLVYQYQSKYSVNVYMPFEIVDVWYYSDSKLANPNHRTGVLASCVFFPIGIALILTDVILIKKLKNND